MKVYYGRGVRFRYVLVGKTYMVHAVSELLFELIFHARLEDDNQDNIPTRHEQALHEEVKSSFEPEVQK